MDSDPTTIFAIIMLGSFISVYCVELAIGRITHAKRPLRDFLFSVAAMFTQPVWQTVVIGFAGASAAAMLLPEYAGAWSELPFWPCLLLIFFLDELSHYWFHRAAHEWRWLWKLHRTHHSGMDMNVGLVFRYNLFWPLLVPRSWMAVVWVYMGLGEVVLASATITYLVNVATHASFRWDLWLLHNIPGMARVWWWVERIVTLPDTHQAHHGYGREANPNGNYAVTLFFLDVLFGTAKFARTRQTHFGLPISPRLDWREELLWPLVRKPLLAKPVVKSKGQDQLAAR